MGATVSLFCFTSRDRNNVREWHDAVAWPTFQGVEWVLLVCGDAVNWKVESEIQNIRGGVFIL